MRIKLIVEKDDLIHFYYINNMCSYALTSVFKCKVWKQIKNPNN